MTKPYIDHIINLYIKSSINNFPLIYEIYIRVDMLMFVGKGSIRASFFFIDRAICIKNLSAQKGR